MTLSPQLYMADSFLEAFDKLPLTPRKKVREFLIKFRNDPTAASIHYEPIHDTRDERVRTVRIDLTYRAVVLHPEEAAGYVLVWVDHHDEAMDWARNKVFPVHPATGALQMLDLQRVEAANRRAAEAPPVKALAAYALFETFKDADLLRAGVPEMLLPSVRALHDEDELERLRPFLPAEAYEALFYIASLGCSIDEALLHAGALVEPEAATVDVAVALAHPDSRRRFHLIESTEELDEILDAPLAKWRIFLHPSQARLVERHFNGPARVLGGAGTGKTVVAMHRARHLARTVFTAPDDRILFTTFTRNLAANIRQNLENLCGAEMARIEVTNLHAWAVALLRRHGEPVTIVEEEARRQCWRNVMEQTGSAWDEAFVQHEWAAVVQAQGIEQRADYLRASRQGQGAPLNRSQRAELWAIFAAYRAELDRLGRMEWPDVIHRATRLLAERPVKLPYRAILVDESQDLDPAELRLLRVMVPAGANDLFFVGDAHQRIYGQPVVMAQCGIEIRGRAAKLRINYRTTEEIRCWATGVLDGAAIDDLDGGRDDLTGYHSILSGLPPTVRRFATLAAELAFVLDEIRVLGEATEFDRICIVARTHSQLRDELLPALRAAGIPYLLLEAETPDYIGSGVRLATMHRVKGLEFEHLFIVGMRAGVMPPAAAVTEADLLRERCLLHVAASRARETLTVTGWGEASPLLR
ncbi:DEAD/DEAH box helicase [Caldilinea sp.]|uniref:DEAD/DEAH box helicase n=1 Tax=Caldilinea sp. TaxID=2293560 RepID=UPI002D05895C|nr:DEAD/DEAH box helicase [Caldilinea sp.]